MLPRWVAYVIVGIGTGIIAACFGMAMLSRSEAAEATKCAAVQGKDIESLRRDVGELKDQGREILAILRERDKEKK
jgi:hypothetical protein